MKKPFLGCDDRVSVTNTSRSIESQVERVMQQARKASTTTVYKRGTEIYFGSIATPPNAVMVGTYTPYSPSEWIYEDLEAAEYEAASEPAVAANE